MIFREELQDSFYQKAHIKVGGFEQTQYPITFDVAVEMYLLGTIRYMTRSITSTTSVFMTISRQKHLIR